jgi:hypothetical protein
VPGEPGDACKRPRIAVGADGIEMAAKSEDLKFGGDGDALYFHGYMEFTDLSGRETYRSGFLYSFYPSVPERGLVTGPTAKHWYYEKIEPDERA